MDWLRGYCSDPEICERLDELINSLDTQELPECAPIWFHKVGPNWIEVWKMLSVARKNMCPT